MADVFIESLLARPPEEFLEHNLVIAFSHYLWGGVDILGRFSAEILEELDCGFGFREHTKLSAQCIKLKAVFPCDFRETYDR
jgi:hypothetical protein